jgi:peptidoglycan/LPS O-acetylase OafA/YrhL
MPAMTADVSWFLSWLKGAACVVIVLHHLAWYGPMAHVLAQAGWPGIAALAEYGRVAVSVFLVCAGYLTADGLLRRPVASWHDAVNRITHRLLRLAPAYWLALVVAVVTSLSITPWFEHRSVSPLPGPEAVAAMLLGLQDILGIASLSAGFWYVAIDAQLYVMAVLAAWLGCKKGRTPGQAHAVRGVVAGVLVVGLALMSLFVVNRDTQWDMWGVYFWATYAMGLLARWTAEWPSWQQRRRVWALVVLVVLAALAVDSRSRILLGLMIATALVAPAGWLGGFRSVLQRQWLSPLAALKNVGAGPSYEVFLLHFPISLWVGAGVTHWAPPGSVAWNAAGLIATVLMSLAVGDAVHRWLAGLSAQGRLRALGGLGAMAVSLAWMPALLSASG